MTEPTTKAAPATGTPVATDPATGRIEREFTVKDRSQFQQTLRRFLRHKLAVGSLVVFLLLVLFAFVGPHLWKYQYTTITPDNSVPPSLKHPFGTDNLGHDMFAQVLRGLQQSIKVALSIALIATREGDRRRGLELSGLAHAMETSQRASVDVDLRTVDPEIETGFSPEEIDAAREAGAKLDPERVLQEFLNAAPAESTAPPR